MCLAPSFFKSCVFGPASVLAESGVSVTSPERPFRGPLKPAALLHRSLRSSPCLHFTVCPATRAQTLVGIPCLSLVPLATVAQLVPGMEATGRVAHFPRSGALTMWRCGRRASSAPEGATVQAQPLTPRFMETLECAPSFSSISIKESHSLGGRADIFRNSLASELAWQVRSHHDAFGVLHPP